MSGVLAIGTVARVADQPVLVPTSPGDRADAAYELRLIGDDLPPEGARVAVEGKLCAESLTATSWRPEPESTSAWSRPLNEAGVSSEVADAVLNSLPEDWPLISTGQSKLPGDRWIATVEVYDLTPEVQEWYRTQPRGAVRLIPFISRRSKH
jgi:hypothetical protein